MRSRLPADLTKTLGGQKATFEVAGAESTVKLAPIFKVSLRTKDAGEARLRHASVQAQLQERWATARDGAVSLSYKEIMALAGLWYRDLLLDHQDEPGDADNWANFQDFLRDGLAYFDPESDGIEREPYDPKQGLRVLSRWFNIDNFLAARGLNVDHQSRTRLVEHVAIALIQGAETLRRRADGDYGPDDAAKRFPTWEPTKRTPANRASSPRATDLLEGWAKEATPAQSTLDLWRTYVESFTRFMGREEASSFQRSDIVRWKLHLIELGNSPKTINDGKLAALKAIFRWGVDNELLDANPASGVSIRRGKKAGEKMLGFEKGEAAIILAAAVRAANPVHRWVPLLCAQSGARVSELCQLRGEDIRTEDGIPFMHFTKQAGTLKNPTSERRVPLHPHVVEAGFLEFVRCRGRGPLFYDPKRRRPEAKKPQPKIVAKNVARWVHTLGIHVGRRFRKDPNHAWRHLFRTLARDAGIEGSVVDAIQGHSASSVGQSYGETLLKTSARAISCLALPGISRSEGQDQTAA